MSDTIVALSSGRPPAAIAVIRVSGPAAFEAVTRLASSLPDPRAARVRTLRSATGEELDHALVIVFLGPASATGEDVVELQCHGGRAVVEAVEAALLGCAGVRRADPGEFTRRALANGRIDLAQAEGLADLLAAETQRQRRAALQSASGGLSRQVSDWFDALSDLRARVEASIDYAEEGDLERHDPTSVEEPIAQISGALRAIVDAPAVERVRDGVRVVLAGPPNAGKSTLVNALAAREVAIVSPIAGTTRDRVEATVQRNGVAYVLVDTAGLTETDDPVEAIGVERARTAGAEADILVWLGDDPPPRSDALIVHARADLPGRNAGPAGALIVSALSGLGLQALWVAIEGVAARLLPSEDEQAVNDRQRDHLRRAAVLLDDAGRENDAILLAEQLRAAQQELAAITGAHATEAMLDALFQRFCLGK